MKTRIFWILGLVTMLAAGPAYSGSAMQMWNCGLEDGVTEEDVEARAAEWVKGVRKIDGGANVEAMVLFPIAVNASGQTDLIFMVTAPTFAEWGRFWDAYPDSEIGATEGEGMFCPDSVIWDAVKIN